MSIFRFSQFLAHSLLPFSLQHFDWNVLLYYVNIQNECGCKCRKFDFKTILSFRLRSIFKKLARTCAEKLVDFSHKSTMKLLWKSGKQHWVVRASIFVARGEKNIIQYLGKTYSDCEKCCNGYLISTMILLILNENHMESYFKNHLFCFYLISRTFFLNEVWNFIM